MSASEKDEIERLTRTNPYKKPQTKNELWWWVKDVLGVAIPRERVCHDHVAPFDAFAEAYFVDHSMVVWKASRGFGGKSFLLALLALTEQITLGASINILGGSFEQSQRVHSYLSGQDPNAKGKFWEYPNAPMDMLISDRSHYKTHTSNGGLIKALAASQKAVRGPHPHRLRVDEADEMDLQLFDAAMGQTMASHGIAAQTVISSTHQYPDKTMTEAIRRANEKGWPVREWCYRENMEPYGWLARSEVERKKTEVTQAMWDTEYELQEPSVEGRAIDTDAIEDLFDKALGVYEGKLDEDIIIIPPAVGRVFYHGADWAKAEHYTVLHSMMQVPDGPDVLAAWLRTGRKPWPVMVAAFDERVARYGGEALHDRTGVGEVIDDLIEAPSEGMDFRQRKARDDMITNYIVAIEQRKMRYPMIRFAYSQHKYATNDDVYSGRKGHLPDSIAAGALCWSLANASTWDSVADLGTVQPASDDEQREGVVHGRWSDIGLTQRDMQRGALPTGRSKWS